MINLEGLKPKINGSEVSEPVDYKKMALESLISLDEEIKHQPVAISIGYSEYKGNNYPVPFGSYGDFSCIVGASKSRKTFFKSMIEAGYIGGQSEIHNPSIKGHYTEGKYVISFDTEQSDYHAQRVSRRVAELVGSVYPMYRSFALRKYSPKERFDFIDWIVNESEYKGKIGLMSIDGYVDLVTDFNSLEQSKGLEEKLLTWTQTGKFHCTGILHKNFGTSKPVGHVGSSILKKAETVVFVEKEDDITVAKCEYSRNIPFEDIYFSVNSDWLPYEVQDHKPAGKEKLKAKF
jgi:hypothetical protein